MKKIVVGISGASGAIYAVRLLAALAACPVHVYLIVSDTGAELLKMETGIEAPGLEAWLSQNTAFHKEARISVCGIGDFYTPPASGSFLHDGMVIVPCSMKSVAAVASGMADNLMLRCADVCLKERRRLILVPRETPLSLVHLENMAAVTRAGAVVLPAMPSFYFKPKTIEALADTVCARILDQLGIAHTLVPRWGEDHV
ncbi:3-octaprenyl-4-hydroxybenzoate carboxy-lyase [Desulfosudis oleivorans Hxd3]|uniref:Flavin prenyltransferase UbiX n=2 Tax=Desulfosudis TaxID=2904716 RepID=A9A095_DESOH|nr:3-octaprenyl-4-hydroxybenzoate carboxy-lyase [Desulfosudis oleivorans Hxd3]